MNHIVREERSPAAAEAVERERAVVGHVQNSQRQPSNQKMDE